MPTFVQLRTDRTGRGGEVRAQAAAVDVEGAARRELKAVADLYGLTSQEVDAAPLGHVQALRGGARLVSLGNQRDGIEVFRDQATVLLDGQAPGCGHWGISGKHRTGGGLGLGQAGRT